MCTCKIHKCDISNCLCACHRPGTNLLEEPKTNEQKREELEDYYSSLLYGMDDEELDSEYKEKLGC